MSHVFWHTACDMQRLPKRIRAFSVSRAIASAAAWACHAKHLELDPGPSSGLKFEDLPTTASVQSLRCRLQVGQIACRCACVGWSGGLTADAAVFGLALHNTLRPVVLDTAWQRHGTQRLSGVVPSGMKPDAGSRSV